MLGAFGGRGGHADDGMDVLGVELQAFLPRLFGLRRVAEPYLDSRFHLQRVRVVWKELGQPLHGAEHLLIQRFHGRGQRPIRIDRQERRRGRRVVVDLGRLRICRQVILCGAVHVQAPREASGVVAAGQREDEECPRH